MSRVADVLRRVQSVLQQQRIRFHLKRVELGLRRADTSHLNEAQRVARQKSLAALREYRERGVFPVNTDYPNQYLPHLKDRFGTYCAVAHLVCSSGKQSLIDELSEQNNLIRIDDVNDGPLLDWLRENGLTRSEAAAIQPTYNRWQTTLICPDHNPKICREPVEHAATALSGGVANELALLIYFYVLLVLALINWKYFDWRSVAAHEGKARTVLYLTVGSLLMAAPVSYFFSILFQ